MAAERDSYADLRPRDQLIAELRSLCAAKRTGTLFIITLENHPAQVVLHDGEIVGVSYRLSRGPDALAPLKLFGAARYRFQPESVPPPDPRLSPTPEILALLGGEPGPVAERAQPASTRDARPVADARPPDSRPSADGRPPASRMAADPAPSFDAEAFGRVRALIERELAEFLGPMAPLILDELLAGRTVLGSPEIATLVEAVAKEIGDPSKEARFTQRVLSQLAG